MQIGQIAARADLPASTIRYYESIGLLPEPKRQSGRRVYDEGVLERLRLVAVAKKSGWSLDEIKQLIDTEEQGGHVSSQWQKIALAKLAELDTLIAQAESMKRLIHAGLACNCTSTANCDLLNS